MNKEQAIKEGIKLIKGQSLLIGTVFGHESSDIAQELIRYEGNLAIGSDGKKETAFPRAEIFDVNKLVNVANHLLNVGFWQEGMESTILNIDIR